MPLSSKNISKPRARRLPHSQWLTHIERCAASGKSAQQYCAAHNLSLKSFKTHDWRRRKDNVLPSANFLPVQIIHEPMVGVSHYEIHFPKGVALKVPNTGSLSSLLKTLEVYL